MDEHRVRLVMPQGNRKRTKYMINFQGVPIDAGLFANLQGVDQMVVEQVVAQAEAAPGAEAAASSAAAAVPLEARGVDDAAASASEA